MVFYEKNEELIIGRLWGSVSVASFVDEADRGRVKCKISAGGLFLLPICAIMVLYGAKDYEPAQKGHWALKRSPKKQIATVG